MIMNFFNNNNKTKIRYEKLEKKTIDIKWDEEKIPFKWKEWPIRMNIRVWKQLKWVQFALVAT